MESGAGWLLQFDISFQEIGEGGIYDHSYNLNDLGYDGVDVIGGTLWINWADIVQMGTDISNVEFRYIKSATPGNRLVNLAGDEADNTTGFEYINEA